MNAEKGFQFYDKFYLIYKVGRFSFAVGLLVLMFSLDSLHVGQFSRSSLYLIVLYSVVGFFILLSSRKPTVFEFLLDELFLYLLAFIGAFSYSFFAIFALFPVFFSAFFLQSRYGYLVSAVAVTAQLVYLLQFRNSISIDLFLQFVFNTIALLLMMLAASKLRKRLEYQELYIRSLEKEKEEVAFYRRLYEISADLAHELKNPLASIKGAVGLLKEGKGNDRIFEIIFKEVDRLDSIIKDFLNLARTSVGEKKRVSVKSLVEEVVSSASVPGKMWSVDGDDVYLFVDFKGFRTAVENLVRNAFQWARSFVRVTVKKKNDWVEIVVEDDGPGVRPEESNRVFEPFYSRRQGGTGLGLSIVRKFAIENGGFVYVVDSPLGGAKFVLRLPAERDGNEGVNSGR